MQAEVSSGVWTTLGGVKKPALEGAGYPCQSGSLSSLEGQQELVNQVRKEGKMQPRPYLTCCLRHSRDF